MSFTIKELEALSGIKAHTIRIWELRYHFLKPSRTPTNLRRYNNGELKTLLTVALLNRYGYKISRIDEMLPGQRHEAILGLQVPGAAQERVINELIGCMVDLRSLAFEELLNRQVAQQGMEATLTGTVFPFLERVGILWRANRLRPVQEKVVSSIIRQKIIHAIEALPLASRPSPLFILFLPEDEHHQLGLLCVYYLLRKKGIATIYLGANLPLSDLHYIVAAKKPHYLYSHLASFPRPAKFARFLQQLQSAASGSALILSGFPATIHPQQNRENLVVLSSLGAVQAFIEDVGEG